MAFVYGELAESIFNNDKIIKETIKHIVEKEHEIITDYKILKNFHKSCSPMFKDDLTKLLEEKKLYLAYQLQSREDQTSALLTLLDYINTLETKNKQIHTQQILEKMKTIEKEIIPFKTVLEIV
jgi:hypothetical protein